MCAIGINPNENEGNNDYLNLFFDNFVLFLIAEPKNINKIIEVFNREEKIEFFKKKEERHKFIRVFLKRFEKYKIIVENGLDRIEDFVKLSLFSMSELNIIQSKAADNINSKESKESLKSKIMEHLLDIIDKINNNPIQTLNQIKLNKNNTPNNPNSELKGALKWAFIPIIIEIGLESGHNLNDNKGQDYLEHTIIELINNFAKSFKYTELKLELNSLFSSFSQEMTIIDLIVIPASAIPEKYVRKTPKYTNLKDYLRSLKIPEIILKEIPTSFDVVGNIAIMEINRNDKLDNTIREFLNSRTNNGPKNMKYKIKVDGKEYDLNTENIKMLIGRGIMSLFRNIKTVVNKKSSIKGEFRLREFEHIAGIKNYHTLHKENGLTFELDLSEAFFSPRLVYERKRVSTLPYREGSIILDAFAGVGPFSLQILSNYPVNVYSIEKNPMAYKYLIKNIKHNIRKLKGEILTYNGDFRDFKDDKLGKGIRNRADCIIMNLPERNLEFINELPYYIKKQDNVGKESNNKENNNAENINYNDYLGEGYTLLIIYLIVPNSDPYNTALSLLKDKFEENHIRIKKILNQRIVKNYSPLLDIIVLDVLIYV